MRVERSALVLAIVALVDTVKVKPAVVVFRMPAGLIQFAVLLLPLHLWSRTEKKENMKMLGWLHVIKTES